MVSKQGHWPPHYHSPPLHQNKPGSHIRYNAVCSHQFICRQSKHKAAKRENKSTVCSRPHMITFYLSNIENTYSNLSARNAIWGIYTRLKCLLTPKLFKWDFLFFILTQYSLARPTSYIHRYTMYKTKAEYKHLFTASHDQLSWVQQ